MSALLVALVPIPVSASAPSPDCLDAPISSAVMRPSSCLVTGPTSEVLAGVSAIDSRAGAIALAGESGPQVVTFPLSGAITATAPAGGSVCLVAASGAAAGLDPAGRLTAAPPGCGAAGAPALQPGALSAAAPRRAAASATTTASPQVGTGPAASVSYYVYAGHLSTCTRVATTTCGLYNAGAAEPLGSLAVLDFGAPCVDNPAGPTVYGSQVFGTSTCTAIAQLATLANAFERGYISAHGNARLILVLGTSNSRTAAGELMTAPLQTTHAQQWYGLLRAPQLQFPGITLWAGSDIEQGDAGHWYGPVLTRDWVDAYTAATTYSGTVLCDAAHPAMMLDYGTDFTSVDWQPTDTYHVAYGTSASCAMPEIYVAANAAEWADLHNQAGVAAQIPFTGVMSAGGWYGYLCSTRSWQALAGATGENIPYLTVIGGTPACGYQGYSILTQSGGLYSFGDATYHGNLIDYGYPGPAIGLANTPDGGGYVILNSGGGIYTFGNAGYYGNLIDQRLPGPAVAISMTPSGHGYAILTQRGGLYTFGDALYWGNLLDHGFPGPAVGFAYTPDGKGYDILTASGAIYSFGNALYFGNLLDHRYPGPATSLAYSINTGRGYAILTGVGGLFTFGDTLYLGNLIDYGYPGPAVAVASTP